ncbi:MAG: hypothetical protein M3069_25060 [Chloroflexota bacterium]|nr:hypothetical protein [Chloroflexota bacterium]
MKLNRGNPEAVLEAGLLLLGLGCVGGLGMVALGRAAEIVHHLRRHTLNPPLRGSVPLERHHHTSTVSAR